MIGLNEGRRFGWMVVVLGCISIAGCSASRDSVVQSPSRNTIDAALQLYYASDLHGAEKILNEFITESRSTVDNDPEETANALGILAGIHDDLGLYESSESLYRQALDLRRVLHAGQDHQALDLNLRNLAFVLSSRLRRYTEAEYLYEESLAIRQRIHAGQDHADIAHALHSLANIRDDLGYYESAESLLKQALDIRRRIHAGQDHKDIARNLSMLAFVRSVRLGWYAESQPLYEELLAIHQRNHDDQDHPDIAYSFERLAAIHDHLDRYESSESLYEKALQMRRRLHAGQDHENIAYDLSRLAFVRSTRLGRHAEAEPLYSEALAMRKRLHAGQDHPDVADSLHSLAGVQYDLADYEYAESLYNAALEMRLRLYPVQVRWEIAQDFRTLAATHVALGKFDSAVSLYESALDMRRRLYEDQDNEEIAHDLSMLAGVHETLGQYGKAIQLYDLSLAMYRRLYPNQEHKRVAHGLDMLGTVKLIRTANFIEAERHFLEVLEIYQHLDSDQKDLNILRSLSNLSLVYAGLGSISEAERIADESVEMMQKIFFDLETVPDQIAVSVLALSGSYFLLGQPGKAELVLTHVGPSIKNDPILGSAALTALGHIRFAMGRAAESELLFEQSLAIDRHRFHAVGDHPSIAASLNNLAGVRHSLGRAAEAEPLYEQALAMNQRLFPGDHPSVAQSLNNLAFVRWTLGPAGDAEPLFEQALAMNQRLFPGDHPSVAQSLNNLAFVRWTLGPAGDAEPLFEQALAMRQRLFPGDHPSVAESLNCLAFVRHDSGRAGEAEPLLTQALAMADRLRLETRGDVESRALMAEKVSLSQIAHDLGRVRLTLGQPEAAFAALETGRARSLMDLFELEYQKGLNSVIAKLPDEQRLRVESTRATEEARRAETMQAEAILASSASRTDLSDEDREQLRQDAVRARTSLGDAVAATNTALGRTIPATRAQDPAELRDALLPGELVVAFGWDGDDAYILTLDARGADGAILFEGMDDREARVGSLRTDLETFASGLRAPGEHDPAVPLAMARALIPERLRTQVSNADRLIVVTTGPLGRVPMDLILSTLNQQAGIVQAHSALQYIERRDESLRRRMARRRARTIEAYSAVVLGRPQYAGSAPELPTYELALAGMDDYLSRTRSAARSLDAYRLMEANLTDLPGTQTEAMVIAASLGNAGLAEGERRVTLLGPDASIPRLMAEVERLRPRVLHIATHGLIGSAEDPLDAALALTPGPDDHGFLTLDDLIRQWPGLLADTDLVVLSACDTGWGATKGDAEFGLPWGFFLAGATSVVASLWQVDDLSTALLMARFHEGRLGSFDEPRTIRARTFQPGTRMTTLDALDEAKAWLRALTRAEVDALRAAHGVEVNPQGRASTDTVWKGSKPSDRPYEHPYYWAAFVLLGSTE